MTAWTAAQVAQVEGLRVAGVIAPEMVHRYPDCVQRVREKLAGYLVRAGHPMGVEIHPLDVVFASREGEFDQLVVEARWRPETTTVELIGGFIDGRRLDEVRKVGEPLVMAIPADHRFLSAETEPTATIDASREVYRFAGWSETERVWLYRRD